ncbi:hypothetical protein [Actinopolymorpha sp. B11F2]|uniref:hypothetical protein n=1 Tax=Actinopolymorpha sp. B11F2 TaxID=3160862 RepID=UPI0032E36BB6
MTWRTPFALRRRRRGSAYLRTTMAAVGVLVLTATACADASRIQQASDEPSPMSTQARSVQHNRLADRLADRAVQPEAPILPVNASFEDRPFTRCPRSWTCGRTGRPATATTTDVAKGGERSLRVVVPAAGDRFTLRSAAMPALPQRTYEATVWRRSSVDGSSGGESVRIVFYDDKRRVIGSGIDRGADAVKHRWEGVSAKARSPVGTSFVEVEVAVSGPGRTVWLDGVKLAQSPILEVWGGTGVRRGERDDTLSLQVTTPTPGGVHVGTIDAFGEHLQVIGRRALASEGGARMTYELSGAARYDSSTRTILVRPGESATIHITGRFSPTPGTGFPVATLGDPMAQAEFPIFVAAQNFDSDVDGVQLPNRLAVRGAVDKLAGYLEERETRDGGWAIAHPYWQGDIRQDPQAIAVLTQGYLKRAQSSQEAEYEAQARRGLEWLVRHQRADGSFGLPWAFGTGQGHFGASAHYHGGTTTHAAGEPLAVVTIAAASALLEGFKVYGNSRYLAASVRAMDYLLRGSNGFQWLDSKRTRGSIPYCSLEPILPPGDPRVRSHRVVSAVRNSSVEVYNIDGAGLSFLKALYVETGDKRLLTYGDAIARNLASKVRADGSIPYSWYESSPHSGGYANIAYTGLLEYGEMRGREDWVGHAARGFSWMANHARDGLVPTEGYASVYGLNLSSDITSYVGDAIRKQRSDGSFSGGEATRHDAVMFAILSDLLLNMGG